MKIEDFLGKKYGLTSTWNFFAEHQGKGAFDGNGAALKRVVFNPRPTLMQHA
jgi:hypothetical protein